MFVPLQFILTALGLLLFPQDPVPPPLPEVGPPPIESEGADEPLPLPGVLPEDTSQEARAAWKLLENGSVAATAATGDALRRWTSFDFTFDIRSRDRDGNPVQLEARQRFLAPTYCRMDAEGRTTARGPSGYWGRDKQGTLLDLAMRERAQDRRKVDEMVAVSRNFLSLLDPSSLRILSARRVPGPMSQIPLRANPLRARSDYGVLAGELTWLEVVTPDFGVIAMTQQEGAAPAEAGRRYAVTLGLDPATGRPVFALVEERRAGQPLPGSALLVHLAPDHYRDVDGVLLPAVLMVHRRVTPTAGARFAARETWMFGVVSGDLNPGLTQADFQP